MNRYAVNRLRHRYFKKRRRYPVRMAVSKSSYTFPPPRSVRERISGAEQMEAHFGGWLRFQNAEVVSVNLDRTGPKLTAAVHAFAIEEPEAAGAPERRTREAVVTFEFDEIADVAIDGFNRQNTLLEIAFDERDGQLGVTFQGVFGMYASFRCEKARIANLEAWPTCLRA